MSARRDPHPLVFEYLRDEVGLVCNGLTRSTHVGWTTDPDKAQAARDAGAKVQVVAQGDGFGFDVSFPKGARL